MVPGLPHSLEVLRRREFRLLFAGQAVSLTGAQAGILTDGVHTKAKIQNITPKRIHQYLDGGNVVIVAGFRGETAA